jgi:hypothetical protein
VEVEMVRDVIVSGLAGALIGGLAGYVIGAGRAQQPTTIPDYVWRLLEPVKVEIYHETTGELMHTRFFKPGERYVMPFFYTRPVATEETAVIGMEDLEPPAPPDYTDIILIVNIRRDQQGKIYTWWADALFKGDRPKKLYYLHEGMYRLVVDAPAEGGYVAHLFWELTMGWGAPPITFGNATVYSILTGRKGVVRTSVPDP